jgi:hypothetical protein
LRSRLHFLLAAKTDFDIEYQNRVDQETMFMAGKGLKVNINKTLGSIIIALLAMAFPFAAAENPPPFPASPGSQPTLEELQSQLKELRGQVDFLEKQVQALAQAKQCAGAPKSSSQQPPSPTSASPALNEHSIYQTGAGPDTQAKSPLTDSLRLGGYASFRYESNSIGAAPRIGSLPAQRRSFDAFDFRRMVLTADATLHERLRFYSELEYERFSELELERAAFPENRGSRNRAGTRLVQELEGGSGSELKMEQAWAQYSFSDYFAARMGVILAPVGRFNLYHDDDRWDTARRPLVSKGGPVLPVAAAWSDLGAGIVGRLPVGKGYFDYQAYVMGGATLDFATEQTTAFRAGRNLLELEPEIKFASGPFDGTNQADAAAFRFAYSPRPGNEIGFSGYHGRYTPDYLTVKESINTAAVDGKFSRGRLEAEGEFVYSDFGRMESVIREAAAQLVNSGAETLSTETSQLEAEVEVDLKGPMTNQRYGLWVDFKYRFWPARLNRTFLGERFENPQLVPIFRYERIWFNGLFDEVEFKQGMIDSFQKQNLSQERFTLGLTYRPVTTMPIHMGWEHNRRRAGGTLITPELPGSGRIPDRSYNSFILGLALGF